MSIKTGKGTRKYFRKSTVNAARDNSLQYLKVQDYDAAVSYLANVFIYKLTHLPPWYVRFLWWFQDHIFITILIIVGILGVIVGLLMMLRRKRIQERQERFNAEMDTLRQRLENPSTAQAPIFSEHCPICMENFPPSHIQRMAQYSQAVENGEEEAFLRNTNWNEDTSVEILPKCGHQFHRECISLWLRRENSCPICRTEDPRSPPGVSPHSHRHNDDNERENRGRRRPDSRRPGPGFDCEEPSHSQRTRSRMMQGLDVLDFVIRPAPVTLSDVFVMRDRQRYTRVIGSAQRSERQFMESIRQMMQEVVSEQSDREHSDRGRSSFGGGSSEGGYSSEGSW
ncbi:hypothetical protein BLNAU_1485 [Blattamonas nauphoetae]|uniref:RING-type domain-containing protein n=1 Tax=Blattamonas nauphoetae TaxID=2049346 RepID=A0ABQ9YI90_9EUKA|nr:hypothetical protein BLNAU_1485 [Blattamonas nauphoetae]